MAAGERQEIVRSQGTTPSERYLAGLAERSFLNLWSYPNIYRDTVVNGQRTGKEICDLLVVCGDHVLIFSDKTVAWPSGDDGRISVLLDCVSAEWIDGPQPETDRPALKHLGLLRLVTTEQKLLRMAARPEIGPKEGDWVELIIRRGRGPNLPLVWTYSAENDYSESVLGHVQSIRFLDLESGPGPISVGAAVAPVATAAQKLRRKFDLRQFGLSPLSGIRREFKRFKSLSHCVVHDVGQAQQCELNCAPDKSVFVDIGEPAAFNAKTFLSGYSIKVPARSFVILTHWDWDHVAAGRDSSKKSLPYCALRWVAPVQIVGPNTFYQIAKPHHDRGHLLLLDPKAHSSKKYGAIQLLFGVASDRNNSGIGVVAKVGANKILISGDAKVDRSGLNAPKVDAVVVAHHGARTGGGPPALRSGKIAIAAVSVGRGNRYRHPDKATLSQYASIGWKVIRTDEQRRRGVPGSITIV